MKKSEWKKKIDTVTKKSRVQNTMQSQSKENFANKLKNGKQKKKKRKSDKTQKKKYFRTS